MNRRQTAQATNTASLEAKKREKLEQREKEKKKQAMSLAVSEEGEFQQKKRYRQRLDAEQYSLKLIDQDQALIEFLKTANFLAKNLLCPFATAFDRVVFINPLKYGNVGRFLSHSCRPNLEMMR
ncbi:Protein CBG14722 [Caenorhabditis briggsae]|nr:Protein CBG14722 [Caenorhabditis briggsae]CAP33164.2 Protein CBG14722 [Caenorhabditis briggsae]